MHTQMEAYMDDSKMQSFSTWCWRRHKNTKIDFTIKGKGQMSPKSNYI